MDMDFDVAKVLRIRLANSLGLDSYWDIMEKVSKTDISKDKDFQRMFNGFYKVRRNEEWRKVYYDYFEKIKDKDPTYKEIITYLYENTGFVEASFSSKLLATLNSGKPIWDRYVIENLDIKLTGDTAEEKLANAIEIYQIIENWYEKFLATQKAEECIQEFDRVFPDYTMIHPIKKIDTILWSIR